MKTQLKPSVRKVLNELKRAAAKKTIKPVLSPLEKAVFNHAGQPFNFSYNGISIYISLHACKQLLVAVIDKLRLLNLLLKNDKARIHIAFKVREVVDDPREILALNPLLRNRLCALECYTLFAIS